MKQFLAIAVILIMVSCSPKLQQGLYVNNFNTYGMFSNSLELNCDSSFVKRFQGDMMDDKSYGSWCVSGDTLILQYDTINHPGSRYFVRETYTIKKGKLVESVSQHSLEKLLAILDTMPENFRKQMKRQLQRGSTPKDFRGNMGRQYLKLEKKIKCRQ